MNLPMLPIIWIFRRRAAIKDLLDAIASAARGNLRVAMREILDALEELADGMPDVQSGLQAIEQALGDRGLIDQATPLVARPAAPVQTPKPN